MKILGVRQERRYLEGKQRIRVFQQATGNVLGVHCSGGGKVVFEREEEESSLLSERQRPMIERMRMHDNGEVMIMQKKRLCDAQDSFV